MSRKYRPYLTLTELKIILTRIQSCGKLEDSGIISYLSKYISDIESGHRKENYKSPPTLVDRLELSSPPSASPEFIAEATSLLSRYKQSMYLGMSPAEIAKVNQLRYENDLMTREEEIRFEAKMMESS